MCRGLFFGFGEADLAVGREVELVAVEAGVVVGGELGEELGAEG